MYVTIKGQFTLEWEEKQVNTFLSTSSNYLKANAAALTVLNKESLMCLSLLSSLYMYNVTAGMHESLCNTCTTVQESVNTT